jgi:hypothetical protein
LWDNLAEEERDIIVILDLIRMYDARKQATYDYNPEIGYGRTESSRSTTSYSISKGDTPDEYRLTYTFLGKCYTHAQPGVVKTFSFSPEKGSYMSHILPLEVLRLTSSGTKDLGSEEYTTAPPSSSALALKWISKCDKYHKNCKATGNKNFLPSRLIDVGDKSSVDPSLLITANSFNLLVGAKYVTLSHCWGSIEIKKLENANLADMKKAIVESSLPQTFQDAIRVTRELGVRYLWIDSLCIIQDSWEDWFQESSRMGDIYSNSYCTISATGAEDGSMGLFLDRKPPPVAKSSIYISARWDGQVHRKSYKHTGTLNHDTKMWEREVDSAPLNQRAWVFQERFLSHRNLMFGRNCLFWECTSDHASETFPDRLPSWMSSSHFKFSGEAALGRVGNIGIPYQRAGDSDEATDSIAKRAWFLMMTGAQLQIDFEGNNGKFAGE